jgi:hypothetical protein
MHRMGHGSMRAADLSACHQRAAPGDRQSVEPAGARGPQEGREQPKKKAMNKRKDEEDDHAAYGP